MTRILIMLSLFCFTAMSYADDHTIKISEGLEWKMGPDSLPPGSKVAVLEGDPSKKGPFTIRLQFPANYKIMPHWHPQIEHITVLEGKFHMGPGEKFDETKAMALPVGGFSVMPVKFKHFAYTSDEPALVQLHGVGPWGITYLNPADDPRKKK